jgi:hypothetical protein
MALKKQERGQSQQLPPPALSDVDGPQAQTVPCAISDAVRNEPGRTILYGRSDGTGGFTSGR